MKRENTLAENAAALQLELLSAQIIRTVDAMKALPDCGAQAILKFPPSNAAMHIVAAEGDMMGGYLKLMREWVRKTNEGVGE